MNERKFDDGKKRRKTRGNRRGTTAGELGANSANINDRKNNEAEKRKQKTKPERNSGSCGGKSKWVKSFCGRKRGRKLNPLKRAWETGLKY